MMTIAALVSSVALSATLTHGPQVGALGPTSVRIWARACTLSANGTCSEAPTAVLVRYRQAGTSGAWSIAGPVSAIWSSDWTARIDVTGLLPSTSYDYEVDVDGTIQAADMFRALPAPGASFARLVVGGDQFTGLDGPNDNAPPWTSYDHALALDPDAYFFIGDWSYPSGTSLSKYRLAYRTTAAETRMRAFLRRVPTVAMLDDHEIRNDWDRGTAPPYPTALRAWNEYPGSLRPAPYRAGVLYYTLRVGPAEVFVADCRTHRSLNSAPDDANKTMLGAQQEADVAQWLSLSPAPLRILALPVPMFDYQCVPGVNCACILYASCIDRWTNFKAARQRLLDAIDAAGSTPVLIASADLHAPHVALWTLASGRTVEEWSGAPIAAFSVTTPLVGPQTVWSASGAGAAWTLLDVSVQLGQVSVAASIRDKLGAIRHQGVITW